MRWKDFAGLGPAPKPHTTPVVDTALLVRALKLLAPPKAGS
jgi:hypothetical protein